MPTEEVNAWGSYENTSRLPRALNGRSPTRANRLNQSLSVPENLLGESLLRKRGDIEGGIGIDHSQSSKYSSEYRTKWSDLFNLDASGHRSIGSVKSSPRVRPTESICELGEMTAGEKDEIKLRDRTKAIFGVYYADSEDQYRNLDIADDSDGSIWSFIYSFNGTMPWLPSFIHHKMPCPKLFLFSEMCLRGIGQVYFQNNPMSGLLILAGLFVQSSRVAVHGIISLVSGNLVAILMGFDKGLMNSGLFGYNSVLVGLAISTFYSTEKHEDYYWAVIVGAIFMAGLSSVLFVMMGKLLVPYKSPPLTLPFNIATLLFLLATAVMEHVDMDAVREPALPDYNTRDDAGSLDMKEFSAGVVRGVGQVYLANNLAAGLLILGGIAVCSRIAALAAFVGSAVGAAIAIATGVPAEMVKDGMYGFNSSLTFTAMLMFYAPSMGASILGVFAGTATIVGQEALSTYLLPYGLPYLTLPFCVAALPFIIIQGTTRLVIAVPLASMTTPEDHMRRVNMLRDGFAFLIEAIESEDRRATIKYGRTASRKLHSLRSSIVTANGPSSNGKRELIEKMNFCCRPNKPLREAWVHTFTVVMFQQIDTDDTGSITLKQFRSYLNSVGMKEGPGLDFAGKAFGVMDLEGSDTLGMDQFIAFAYVSRALKHVKDMIANFFAFVDTDCDGEIDLNDLDAASEYIGEAALSDVLRERLSVLCGGERFCTVDMINFATMSKLKDLVRDYRPAKLEEPVGKAEV